jgi:riboflavin kinase/FMN adenylyltransferase
VYAAYATIQGQTKKGMLSIGNRPTLKDSMQKVEINIFEWDKDIYGEKLRFTVKKFLRKQEKYASLEELKKQLATDKDNSLQVL